MNYGVDAAGDEKAIKSTESGALSVSNVPGLVGDVVMLQNGATADDTDPAAVAMPASTVTIQVDGITTATVTVQMSNDGANWGDAITTPVDGHWVIENEPWAYIRAKITSYSSGTINVRMNH